jgi:hypothetical protein
VAIQQLCNESRHAYLCQQLLKPGEEVRYKNKNGSLSSYPKKKMQTGEEDTPKVQAQMDDCQGRIERYKAIPSKKKKES